VRASVRVRIRVRVRVRIRVRVGVSPNTATGPAATAQPVAREGIGAAARICRLSQLPCLLRACMCECHLLGCCTPQARNARD